MKKTIFGLCLTLAPALAVHAAPNNVGCGLGSTLFEGQRGMAPQVLAVTTNGTSGNQTFGITSGTSGCASNGVVTLPAKTAAFADENLNKLARDMSSGEGESLHALAALMGIEDQHKAEFFAATQANFAQLFPHEQVTSNEMLLNLNDMLAAHPVLSQYRFG